MLSSRYIPSCLTMLLLIVMGLCCDVDAVMVTSYRMAFCLDMVPWHTRDAASWERGGGGFSAGGFLPQDFMLQRERPGSCKTLFAVSAYTLC